MSALLFVYKMTLGDFNLDKPNELTGDEGIGDYGRN
jgi:hypothetical protein